MQLVFFLFCGALGGDYSGAVIFELKGHETRSGQAMNEGVFFGRLDRA